MKLKTGSFALGIALTALFSLQIQAQVKIGEGSRIPDGGAMLEIQSSNRGFLPPRISLTSNVMQLNSIQPADGMVVYNTNTSTAVTGLYGVGLYVWNNGKWNYLADRDYVSTNFAAKSANTTGAAPQATGQNAFAIGRGTIASSLNSFAYGGETEASNYEAFAGGLRSKASGLRSIALGMDAVSSSDQSVAIGTTVTTSGKQSFSIGTNITNARTGSMGLSDFGGGAMTIGIDNQFVARFTGGYVCYTSGSGAQTGWSSVYLNAGDNAWRSSSDKRKKENFEFNDGESFLQKIDTMWLGSWNYKGQDSRIFRHYGPMAQDFYGAFGKDQTGIIGNDTSIASMDYAGVNMIAIKGLVSRTNRLKAEKESMKAEIENLKSDNSTLRAALSQQQDDSKRRFLAMQTELDEQKKQLQANMNEMAFLIKEIKEKQQTADHKLALTIKDTKDTSRKK